jgi:hypothetical protein
LLWQPVAIKGLFYEKVPPPLKKSIGGGADGERKSKSKGRIGKRSGKETLNRAVTKRPLHGRVTETTSRYA